MIQATTPHSTIPLWPNTRLSAEAREISMRREELLGLLKDLPETEYELSFSDLVERQSEEIALKTNVKEVKEGDDSRDGKMAVKERKKRRSISSGSRSCSFGSNGGGGVFLNVYMPASLTKSLTMSRASRVTTVPKVALDYPESEPVMLGCLPGFWGRIRKGKSGKRVAERTRSRESKSTV